MSDDTFLTEAFVMPGKSEALNHCFQTGNTDQRIFQVDGLRHIAWTGKTQFSDISSRIRKKQGELLPNCVPGKMPVNHCCFAKCNYFSERRNVSPIVNPMP
jgi:hypothetical protein